MSNLVEHAKRELALLGNGPMIDDHVIQIVQIFADAGHSGTSASYTAHVINKLLRFENLMPLTSDPDEWYEHEGHGENGSSLWQNKRNSEAFSTDGGKSYRLNSESTIDPETGKRTPGPFHTSLDHTNKEEKAGE